MLSDYRRASARKDLHEEHEGTLRVHEGLEWGLAHRRYPFTGGGSGRPLEAARSRRP